MWVLLMILGVGGVQGLFRPLVRTNQGLVRGLRANDGDYSMFLGIPYGKVREDNPFGASVPHPRFNRIFDASDDSAKCPQREEFNNTLTGTLDCLRLNVYVPNRANWIRKVPVLVWIHGGGFFMGDGGRFVHGPRFFVRHDIILVSLNYRLGPYGFMCLNTPDVPGNQGLKDQLLALRWIRNNIGAFGGDVNKITVMGESAGSVSVELQLRSKQEKLFQQVILQSGSALGPWAITTSPSTRAPVLIAARLGFATDNVSEALSFLAKIEPTLIIGTASLLGLNFSPCVEQEFENVESLISEHPFYADTPKFKDVKVLMGFNNKEQLIPFAIRSASDFENLNVFRTIWRRFRTDENFQDMEDVVRRFYIGDEKVTKAVRWSLMDFESDWFYNYPTQWSITDFLEKGVPTIYYYVFSYSGGRNFVKERFRVTEEGAAHADELGYQFDVSYKTDTPSQNDQRIIDQMSTLWTNYVKYGDPTPRTTNLLPVKWIPVTKDVFHYLDIDSELELKRRVYSDRLSFWQVFYKANWDRLLGIND